MARLLFFIFISTSISGQDNIANKELLLKQRQSSKYLYKQIKQQHDSAYVFMQNDKYYQSFKLLDSALQNSKLNNFKDLEAKNYHLKGIAYAQLYEYNLSSKYYLKGIRLNRVLGKKEAVVRSLTNLLHNYMLEKNYKKYDSLYLSVINATAEFKTNLKFYIYETELMANYDRGHYQKILSRSNEALIELEKEANNVLFIGTDLKKLLKKRLKTTYQLYHAYGSMELGIQPESTNLLLTYLESQDLENILWYSVRVFENISRIYHYKHQYFTKHNVNIDSAFFYFDKLKNNNEFITQFLINKSKTNNHFLIDYLETENKLQQSKLRVKLQDKEIKNSRIKIGFTLLFAIIVSFLILNIYKNNQFKSKINAVLQLKNENLEHEISEKNTLSRYLDEIQEEINWDLQDNLGNKIAGIINVLDVLKDLYENKHLDSSQFVFFLSHFETNLNILNEDIKDLIWANNPNNNQLSELVLRLKTFANSHNSVSKCKVKLHTIMDENYALPPLWNRQILLIFKEAILNACMHAEVELIQLNIYAYKNKLKIICKDEGKGFNKDLTKFSSGISNMVKRAKSIDGMLKIKSFTNKGTIITFDTNLNR